MKRTAIKRYVKCHHCLLHIEVTRLVELRGVCPFCRKEVKRRHKFNAQSSVVDGQHFPSKAEARRYGELKLLLKAGEIRNLRSQVRYEFRVNGNLSPFGYIADFVYERHYNRTDRFEWQSVVEDVKGIVTREFRMKKWLMLACYGIIVEEVRYGGRKQ